MELRNNVEEMRREIMRLKHIVEAMGSAADHQLDDDDDHGRRKRPTMSHDNCYDASEVYMNGVKRPRVMLNSLQVPTMSGNKAYQVFVKTHDHSNDKTLNVRDGYQWRKYGQKVTKDNPSPRAYFKCAMSPTCPVKKKVQRSVEDDTILVVSYEGQHNHNKLNSDSELHLITSPPTMMIQTTPDQPSSSVTLDLSLSSSSPVTDHYKQYFKDQQEKSSPSTKSSIPSFDSQNLFKKVDEDIIKKYVVSLTKDPNFSMALAMAVARSIPEMARP